LTGRETTIALTDEEMRAVNEYLLSLDKLPLTSKAVITYSKIIVYGQVIQSRSMTRAKQSNSYTVSYCEDSKVSYGLLDKLICSGESNLAVINKLEVIPRSSSMPAGTLPSTVIVRLLEDFVDIRETGVLAVINIEQILMQCFNVSVTRTCTQLTHCVNSIESIL
jgi:hypothetical protein